MRRGDGWETVLEFCLPVPFGIVAPVLRAVGEALEAEGWRDVSLSTDGRHTVLARPPDRAGDRAAEAEEEMRHTVRAMLGGLTPAMGRAVASLRRGTSTSYVLGGTRTALYRRGLIRSKVGPERLTRMGERVADAYLANAQGQQ